MSASAMKARIQEVQLDDDSLEALKKRVAGLDVESDSKLAERFERVQEGIAQAEKIKDAVQRDRALEVIKATLDSLMADAQKDQKDLAEQVNDLDSLIEHIGTDFVKLSSMNEDEQALITAAEKNLNSAKNGWIVFSRAEKIKLREQMLTDATNEAKALMRKRLMNMNFEQSTQILQTRTAETIRVLNKRREEISEQLAIVSGRKKSAQKVMAEAATTVKDLVGKADRLDERLRDAEKEQAEMQNGTPEYAEQVAKVSKYRQQATELNGQVNIAKDILGTKERFALQLEVFEIGQIKARDTLAVYASGLKSEMEERVHTINARLAQAKAMSDQEIASNLDKLGAKLDQVNTEYMAKSGRVSDELRLRRAEAQPQRMRDLEDVRRGQAQAHQETLEREHTIMADFEKRYGIDPYAGFFSRPEDSGQKAA